MSKSVRELLFEFQSQDEIEDDFQFHVLKVKVDDNGEIEDAGNALPVINVELDVESSECLLHFEEGAPCAVTVLEIKKMLGDTVLDYEVCAAEEKTLDGTHVRLDTPLIGFGENIELKCFFVVCQAS